MTSSTHLERQDEEFQVLESIFGEDLVDLRQKVVWKIARPMELKLSLKPQQSMGGSDQAFAQLDMVIKCPPRYPDVVPEISLLNPRALSDQQISQLKEKLNAEALESVGEVMIWQLANTVQEFLHQHNQPPPQSFYEQMINNRKQQQERTEEMERKKEEHKRQQMELDMLRRQEALRNENRLRRENLKNTDASTPLLPPGTTAKMAASTVFPSPIAPSSHSKGVVRPVSPSTPLLTGSSSKSIPVQCNRRQRRTSTPKRLDDDDDQSKSPGKDPAFGSTVLVFCCSKTDRTVRTDKCLGHSTNGSTMYVGTDAATGEDVAIAEWVMKWRHYGKRVNSQAKEEDVEGATHMKQILNIEQELLTLLKLKHPNLIHYLGFRHQYDPGKITAHVLMEYSRGTNLSFYTHYKDRLSLEMLRSHTCDIVEAIQYLHTNGVVHRKLQASSVFVESNGRLRLGQYSVYKRLDDLYQTVDKDRPGVHFCDTQPMVLGRGGQRGDIYRLGLMLLTLIQGGPLVELIPEVPTHLPGVVQDFLHKCLLKDERLRWTAVQLQEHSFLRDPLPSTSTPSIVPNKQLDDHESVDSNDEAELDYLSSLVASGHSRLASEFELLKVLGKGGFGDVIKVKNKLDGRFYAIKRIPLNPKSKLFNKKMKREVKLLSRLNHENVVRYYCSWIEISDDPIRSESSSSYTASFQRTETPAMSKKAQHIVMSIPLTKTPVLTTGVKSGISNFDPVGDIESAVPRVGDESVEWLTSFDKGVETLLESSSDEEDEADVFGSSFMPKMDSSEESVVFDTDGADGDSKADLKAEENTEPNFPDSEPEELMVKILYIQMEYCEKSTLRSCIDSGLPKDMNRVWRLFREIVEGLMHIHDQGMIHRDLKPVNIFLDSHDHVKIGDFGLATTDILAKEGALCDITLPSPQDVIFNQSRSCSGDGNLTGKVGTALYVSPEVMLGGGKLHYDQKVDIYSLGIIFFEMCYKCLPTGMERVKTLSNLRLANIVFPEDFDENELTNQGQLIRWLLNHNSALRPTSKELLASDLLPPAEMHATDLSELLRSTIGNPQSSSHRQMLNTIFNQSASPSDPSYCDDIYESMLSNRTSQSFLHQHVEACLVQVFSNHGAVCVRTPLFLPRLKVYEHNEQLVQLMDHRGGIVSLPFDQRVPFARYVGRSNIQSLKRYAIEKVFREKKFYNVMYNVHPRELTECAFDIIASSRSLIPDAEVLSVVQEIINKFPSLQARNYYVRINHMSLLRAVLLHCGILENVHHRALTLLAENIMNKTKRISVLEMEMKLTEQMSAQLKSLLDIEGPIGKVTSLLRCITKTMGQASTLAKSGLHDMEHILTYASCLGLKLQVLVSVGLIYSPHQYSDVFFHVMCDKRKEKRVVTEVLAAGGRYDKLIEKYTSPLYSAGAHGRRHGVGISISFERLMATVGEEEMSHSLSVCDVVVCTLGHQQMVKERLAIIKDLWIAGFRAEVMFERTEDFDELQENCKAKGISHIIILKDGETSSVKVRSLEGERITEKIVMTHHLVEYLQRKTEKIEAPAGASSVNNSRLSSKEIQIGFGDSSHTSSPNNANTNTFNYNIVFVSQDKASKNLYANPHAARRRHEVLIAGKVSTQFPWLPEKNLEVLALDMPTSGLKTIQAYIELGTETAFEASIGVIMEKQSKLRKYLVGVFDVIHDLKFKKKRNFLLLYSTKEESLKLLT